MALLDEINNKSHQFIIKKAPYDNYIKTNRETFEGHNIIHATLPTNMAVMTNFLKAFLINKNTYVYFFSKELRPYF